MTTPREGVDVLGIEWVSESTLTELTLLLIAFVLSAVVGVERQRKLKSAGLRTHALVGVGSAVFTLVSAYGFQTVTGPGAIVDPSRIAAQIVSGIGFLGAGVIFVRQNTVSGLTTAASIWVTASIGMACGAGEPVLAIMATALHLLAVWSLGKIGRRIRQEPDDDVLLIRYREGNGALRNSLVLAAQHNFEALLTETKDITKPGKQPRYQASISLRSRTNEQRAPLLEALANVPGVLSIVISQPDRD